MTAQIYKVRDPTGAIREIRGPAGASDEEVIAQAQKLLASQPETPKAPERKPFSMSDIPRFAKEAFTNPSLSLVSDADAPARLGYRAGGAVTDVAAKAGASPELAGGLGFAANVGIQAIPAFIGGAGGKAAAPAMKNEARYLMQNALKPSRSEFLKGNAAKAIDTMLDEGFVVSQGSVDRMRKLVDGLNQEVKQAIAASPATVNKNVAATSLQMAVNRFEKQVNPQSDLKTIYKAWNEFLSHPLLSGKNDIPVQLAQELKQGTYKALGSKAYGELKGAEIEAQKVLAHGLRNEISKAVPAVEKLNEREGRILNAMLMNEARVMINNNRDPGGLAYLVNNPHVAAGYIVSRSSGIKSFLAHVMNKSAKQAPTLGRAAGAAYGSTVLGAEE